MTTPLFRPTAPPDPSWRHFATRGEAVLFCQFHYPPDLHELARIDRVYLKSAADIPPAYPHALTAFHRVYDAIVARCPKPTPIVFQCAGDAGQAALQLHVAARTGILEFERRLKWEPFAQGYGCVGLYRRDLVTYDPPAELTARAASSDAPRRPVSVPASIVSQIPLFTS